MHDVVNGAVMAWVLEQEAAVTVVLTLVVGLAVLALVRPRPLAGKYLQQAPPGWKPMEGYSGTLGKYRPETPHQVIARLRGRVKELEAKVKELEIELARVGALTTDRNGPKLEAGGEL